MTHILAKDRLRLWREEAKLSRVAAAKVIGCSASCVAHIEAGRRTPALQTALGIERATGGSISVDAWGEESAA